MKQESPISFRVNDEDKKTIAYLQKRLGLTRPQVLKLALRRLEQEEKLREKK